MDARFSDKPAINRQTALTVVALHEHVISEFVLLFQMMGNILKIIFLIYTLIFSIEVTVQGKLIIQPQKAMGWVWVFLSQIDKNI